MSVAHILVVDDDAAIRELVRWTLEDGGYVVTTVNDGHAALEWMKHALATSAPPSVIILDMAMPNLDGRGFCAAYQQRQWLSVPIVLFSADRTVGTLVAELGAQGFLAKPFTVHTLLDTVARALQGTAPGMP